MHVLHRHLLLLPLFMFLILACILCPLAARLEFDLWCSMRMHLQDLPTQLWASVACSLPAGSVLNLELVCKEIWLKVSDPVVWVELFNKDFWGDESEVHAKKKEITDWKLLYKHFYQNNLLITLSTLTSQFFIGDQVEMKVTLKNICKMERMVGEGRGYTDFMHGAVLRTSTGKPFERVCRRKTPLVTLPLPLGTQTYDLCALAVERNGICGLATYPSFNYFLPLLQGVEEEIIVVFETARGPEEDDDYANEMWHGRLVSNSITLRLNPSEDDD